MDQLELSSFNERLLDIMPLRTEESLTIPQYMYSQFPKNVNEFKNKRFDKVLNKFEGKIADMDNTYKSWFSRYTRKYFNECIGHDSNSFLKNTILPDLSDIRQIGSQHNNPFISFGKVNGAVIEAGDTSASDSADNGLLFITKAPSLGTVGQYYDQIAINILTHSGNNRQGLYDDSSNPNNLLGETASTAESANVYSFVSFSGGEVALTTAQTWFAFQIDNATAAHYRKNASLGSLDKTFTYGANPNPAGSGYSATSANWNQKIGHS